MIPHKRYFGFRTERQEKQNRWLTILASAIIIVLIAVVTAGPAIVGTSGNGGADFDSESLTPDSYSSSNKKN